ncbi:MAG TPA: bifunctional acetate--CoA ligase family protein/GNAT family N-acetyltransferase [candidate division Zixibacteria bacterium]|nr:bifunctional acetate--CoA ligase family protein/GNAT family N-acetyltransferase [candidate division Zixibacteria bacterium]
MSESRGLDRAGEVLGHPSPLQPFFTPRSVAVIGATEAPGKVGRTLMANLVSSPFGGTVFPVNARRSSVLGVKAYPTIADVPDAVELAVVVTPASTVPGVIEECAAAGVRAAIVISAGFKEVGPEGAALEDQILATARRSGMRVIGPNCLGVMNPIRGLNATFAAGMARPGSVAFISQSGALLTAILDWAELEHTGFSAIVSLGSMLDVGWGDVIYHLGDDPNTGSIVIYMETIGDARSFLSAAREVALTKPIIVIKPGRTEAAARAAASHTGSLTGSDEVLDAAFRRVGVLRVEAISDLFGMAEVLAKQPRPRGRRLSIVTNAGGPAVIATDELISGGGELAPLGDETRGQLDGFLPPAWSHNNPIDVLGDADAERYRRAVEIASANPDSDGLLVILTPQAMTEPTETAGALVPFAHQPGEPVLASWMGGPMVADGVAALQAAGIPAFAYPDAAVRMFNYLWRYADNLRLLYETPVLPGDLDAAASRAAAEQALEAARREGRTLLTEVESKAVLSAYGIPVADTRVAAGEDEATAAAEAIGYPVVLKLYSRAITHKTDVGGVKLNLTAADKVREAFRSIRASVAERAGPEAFEGVTVQPMINYTGYELIVGSSVDAQFGPVLLFGLGGTLVEVLRDRALALPPLTTTLARRLIERTRVATALRGVRGRRPVDMDALEQLLVRFSRLVVEVPRIAEVDINPLLASAEGLMALDARVVLHPESVVDPQLPRPAIRPYPVRYVGEWEAADGTRFTIRPIRPEDEPLMVRFHGELSEESVYARYFRYLKLPQRTAHERLTRICFIDYDREMALVAETRDPESGEPLIAGVGRLSKSHGRQEGEFAILIADRWQRRGLGTELLRRLVEVGRREGLGRVFAEMLAGNAGMRRASQTVGFTVRPMPGDPQLMLAELQLVEPAFRESALHEPSLFTWGDRCAGRPACVGSYRSPGVNYDPSQARSPG